MPARIRRYHSIFFTVKLEVRFYFSVDSLSEEAYSFLRRWHLALTVRGRGLKVEGASTGNLFMDEEYPRGCAFWF